MADNEEKKDINPGYGKALFGRRVIYTDETEVTAENVLAVLRNAFPAHVANRCEINYLYNYYKGKQPILERTKAVRPEICNRVVANIAYDIVDFKVSYLLGTPFSYVATKDRNEAVDTLNGYMNQVGKDGLDKELIEWNHICGTAYRYVQALEPSKVEDGDAPFDLFTLDPRTTFVIYSSTFKKTRLAGVTYTISETDGTVHNFVVYTKDKVFTFGVEKFGEKEEKLNGFVVTANTLGDIPIFEYPANNARLGAFETVLPLLDAYNRITSNDVDGIEQTIQSFLKFVNCDLDADALANLREYGAIKLKSIDGAPADVDSVKTDYSYDGANLTKTDIYRNILLICGMPIVGNGKSISANNGAIYISSGFSQAESKAKASETMFKASERLMLNLVLKICKTIGKGKLDIRATDLDCKSTRTNYENLQVKAQVLCEMLNTPRVHPKLAFESCGLFSDPENAYMISEAHYKDALKEWKIEDLGDLDKAVNGYGGETTETVRTDGRADSATTDAVAEGD